MNVTNHAVERITQRVGGSKNRKSTERIARKAFEHGYTINDTKGELNYWMNFVSIMHGHNPEDMRLYGNTLYVFGVNENLVTVLNVPDGLKQQYRKLIKPQA